MDDVNRRRLWWEIAYCAIGFACGAGGMALAGIPGGYSYSRTLPNKGKVWTVILRHLDGDTVQIGSIVDEGTARLLDIDAPETRTKDLAEKARGKVSAARLAELMPVNSVWRTEVNGHDGFDRPLVRFYREDGKTINQQMLDEGFASDYHSLPLPIPPRPNRKP